MTSPDADLAADPSARLLDGRAPVDGKRGRRIAASVAACLFIHVFLLTPLFLEFLYPPPVVHEEQAIPIQVVPEPPPPPPPPPPPKTEAKDERQKTAELDEKIATDAPRAANDDPSKQKAPDKKSGAPKADPAPPAPAAPAAAAETPPDENRPDAEVIRQAAPRADSPQQAKPTPAPAQPVAMMAIMPDFASAAAARPAQMAIGKADPTYLSEVFGKIINVLRPPPGALQSPALTGDVVIAFVVDGQGRVSSRSIARSSGVAALDQAALAAVDAGAPYPKTPIGDALPMSFVFPGTGPR